MKENLHPAMKSVEFECSCGHSTTIMSAADRPRLVLDTCRMCDPAYTGKRKSGVVEGRAKQFNDRYGAPTDAGV
ncbi:MAG: 50S ribosomal protein L31 [Pseudomonadota bacterium]